MSRTKHTRPPEIIAASRLRNPRGKRVADDLSAQRRASRILKDLGIEPTNRLHEVEEQLPVVMPKISVQRPRTGFHHPAGKSDILTCLKFFGELSWYGIEEIRLAHKSDYAPNDLKFGALATPGTIILYEQPTAPWLVPGTPSDIQTVLSAGAQVTLLQDGSRCKIEWTPDTLRDFMLFDVLMHEIGHHLVQQFTGKRPTQVMRTKDHEFSAHNFSRRCRESFTAEVSG